MRHIISQATRHFEAGALDEAKTACNEALALLPHDPAALRLLGLIAAAKHEFGLALSLLEPFCSTCDDDPMVHTAIAEAVWAERSAEAAIPFLERVLQIDPLRHRVRGRLGTALLQAGKPILAARELKLAVEARPEDSILRLQLGLALKDMGELGAAIEHLRAAARLAPEPNATLLTILGDALLEAGDLSAAMASLAQAVQRDPTSHVAWMLLGRAATLDDQRDRAVSCFRRALETVPTDGEAKVRAALANALHAAGQITEAEAVFADLMRGAKRQRRNWRARQRRVGVLAAPGAANTPTDFLLDRAALSVEPVFLITDYPYCPPDLRAQFDIIFNVISDADEAPAALRSADRLCAEIDRHIINPPGAIRLTTRDAMANRLTGIPGAIIPVTLRCQRTTLLSENFTALRFPLLLRPIGSHGGKGLVRCNNPVELAAEASSLLCNDVYITEYYAFGSTDGWWRKYRVVFVGGASFPYHVSIGHDWLNHYFRRDTSRDDAVRAEEIEFLQNPQATLGPLVMAALRHFPGRVGLDYFGVDFAINDAGQMIVFECNAAMRVRPPREPTGVKATAAARIRDAMTQLVMG